MSKLTDRIKSFQFPGILSNMYVLVEGKEALIVDPIISDEAMQYLHDQKVEKVTMLLTHEHFDHTNGIPLIKREFDSTLICQREAMHEKRQKHFNRPLVVSVILHEKGLEEEMASFLNSIEMYYYKADVSYEEEMRLEWKSHVIRLVHAPGHSPASSLIYLDDEVCFTGDSLIPGKEPTLRWPWSDKELFYKKTRDMLLDILDEIIIFPGHESAIKKGSLFYNGVYFEIKGEDINVNSR